MNTSYITCLPRVTQMVFTNASVATQGLCLCLRPLHRWSHMLLINQGNILFWELSRSKPVCELLFRQGQWRRLQRQPT